MSVAILPSDPILAGGLAEVTFRVGDGETRLAHLHQTAPLRVLFPHVADDEIPSAALVTTAGGVVGGDRLSYRLDCEPNARAQFVAQAAEKIYRSTGADSKIEVTLQAGPGSWLEYLPQETILFEGARLRRRTRIDAAAGASVLAGEMLVFGRTARGEIITRGLLRDAWEVRRDGKLIWADAQHLDGDIAALLAAPAGFSGAVATATLVLIYDDPARLLAPLRERLTEQAAATIVNGVLLVRWLSDNAQDLRQNFAAVWASLRHDLAGLPKALPRLWHI